MISIKTLSVFFLILITHGRSYSDLSWHKVTPSPVTCRLHNILWGGNQFVIVGDSGTILTSVDGIAWQKQNVLTSRAIGDICFTGKKYIATGSYNTLLSSLNGVEWINDTAKGIEGIICWVNNRLFVFRGNSQYTSEDSGTTWSVSKNSYNIKDLIFDGLNYIAVGDTQWWENSGIFYGLNSYGVILKSQNGTDWKLQPNIRVIRSYWNTIIWTGDTYLVAGCNGMMSKDGVNWTSQFPYSYFITACYYNHKLFYLSLKDIIYYIGDLHGSFKTDPDYLTAIAANDNVAIAVSENGSIYTANLPKAFTNQKTKPAKKSITAIDQSKYLAVFDICGRKIFTRSMRHLPHQVYILSGKCYLNGISQAIEK